MGMAVLPVGVIEKPREDYRPAGAAGGDRGEGVRKPYTLLGQTVLIRGLDHLASIGAYVHSLVVGDHHQDVLFRRNVARATCSEK